MSDVKIFPKIYRTGRKQRVSFTVGVPCERLSVRIQPMETYGVEHTPIYRIDEESRYPLIEAEKREDGAFYVDYDFAGEQKYSLRFMVDGTLLRKEEYVYAAEDDLFDLGVFKCDTHLHSCRSDGKGTPFEVGIAYRRAGYDFIALTDHHKMNPSVEAKEQFEALTDKFFVIRAEEVHNRGYGYFHIINLGGEFSVNSMIEAGDGAVDAMVEKHLSEDKYPEGVTPYVCAFRQTVSELIRKGGGLAVMAHPFWSCYGEYNMQPSDMKYLLKSGCYDALELLADCDLNGNGSNLQVAMWCDLLSEGVRIPTLGASDAHNTYHETSYFNKQFSLIFAKDRNEVLTAIKDGKCVAVRRRSETDFFVHGSFRLVKYARFLLDEYYPTYVKLTEEHAEALTGGDRATITLAEENIEKYHTEFYAN